MRLGRLSWCCAPTTSTPPQCQNQIETMCNIMETPAAVEGMKAFLREAQAEVVNSLARASPARPPVGETPNPSLFDLQEKRVGPGGPLPRRSARLVSLAQRHQVDDPNPTMRDLSNDTRLMSIN